MSGKNCPNCEKLQERDVALEQLVKSFEERFARQDAIIAEQAEHIRKLENELAKRKRIPPTPRSRRRATS